MAWAGLVWFRIGTNSRLFKSVNESSGSINHPEILE
jgi:hypothetical protein